MLKQKMAFYNPAITIRSENALKEGAIQGFLHAPEGHPNVLGALETCEDENHLYYVMEYCTGGELFDLIKARNNTYKAEGGLPNSVARQHFSDLVNGVAHMHSKLVTHSDISLENSLWTKENGTFRSLIIDFGESQPTFPLPATRHSLLTNA